MEQQLQKKLKKRYHLSDQDNVTFSHFSTQEDEIDLLEIVWRAVRVLKSRAKVFWSVLWSVFLAAAVFYPQIPHHYESFMVLRSSTFKVAQFRTIFMPLKESLRDRNLERFSDQLGLEVSAVENIDKVFIDKPEDSSAGYFNVAIRVNDKIDLESIQQALIEYFNSYKYMRTTQQKRREKLQNSLQDIDQELTKLEQAQTSLNERLASRKEEVGELNSSPIFMDNYSSLSDRILALKEKKYNYTNELSELQNVEIFKEFHSLGESRKVGVIEYGLMAFAIAVAIALLTVFGLEFLVFFKKQEAKMQEQYPLT